MMNYIKDSSKKQFVEMSKRKRRLILLVMALALMTVVSAVSGLNVALPDLARSTGATQSQLQWIVDAYTMVFAGLLLTAGALGDRYGRKGMLLFGLFVFGGGAAGAMFADNPTVLIALRSVMGMGAAFIMPTTLSIITTSFPPEERSKAVGVWVGMAGGGAVLGLFGAGFLLEYFSWSSFFGLNVVLAVLGIIGTLFVVPRSRDIDAPALDVPGGLLSLFLVTSLVFGIIEGPERGWGDTWVLGSFVTGVLSLIAFIAVELRTKQPLLDPRLFKLRGFSSGTISMVLQFFSFFGFIYVIIQYLQYVSDYSPLKAAFALLPLPLTMIPLARQAPMIAKKIGINRLGSLGLSLMAVGLVIISALDVELNYAVFAVGLILFAVGMAFAGTPATAAIISSLPASKQGVASAVNDVSREFGSALGIALLGSILNDSYKSYLHPSVAKLPSVVAEHAEKSIVFVKQAPLEKFGIQGTQLLDGAKHSYINASRSALLTAASFLIVTALYVLVRGPRKEQPQ